MEVSNHIDIDWCYHGYQVIYWDWDLMTYLSFTDVLEGGKKIGLPRSSMILIGTLLRQSQQMLTVFLILGNDSRVFLIMLCGFGKEMIQLSVIRIQFSVGISSVWTSGCCSVYFLYWSPSPGFKLILILILSVNLMFCTDHFVVEDKKCVSKEKKCDQNAFCELESNTISCTCKSGFQGDGTMICSGDNNFN